MYLTRDLDLARRYCDQRYADDPVARYGLLASSHAKLLPKFGVDNSWLATSHMNVAKWYNAPSDDPKSCCQLEQPVTEFSCQGLELDLPIVAWGEDFLWSGVDGTTSRFAAATPSRIRRRSFAMSTGYFSPAVETDSWCSYPTLGSTRLRSCCSRWSHGVGG